MAAGTFFLRMHKIICYFSSDFLCFQCRFYSDFPQISYTFSNEKTSFFCYFSTNQQIFPKIWFFLLNNHFNVHK